jgi:hypothetical protein
MKRIIAGALFSLALLASPLWARPEHGGSQHGGWNRGESRHGGWNRGGWNYGGRNRGYGYGSGYGYGYPYRPWYFGRTYVAPTYVVPEYPASPQYSAGYQADPTALVSAWYQRYLGRDMDSGASFWIDQIRSGAEPSAELAGILAGDEYYQRAGATPNSFVERLYVEVAGRRPSQGEMDVALSRIGFLGRIGVANGVLQQFPDAVTIR